MFAVSKVSAAHGPLLPAVGEVADISAFAALREEWDDLLQASSSNCLFLTWEWLATWWKHLAETRRLSIMAVRANGRLIGLAPFGVRPPSLACGHPFRVLEFLGCGHAGSDYLDVIVRAYAEPQVIPLLAARLTRARHMMKLANLSPGARIADIAALLGQSGWTCGTAKTNVCPYIALGGKTWESYLAGLGSAHRYNYHRKWRRLNRDYAVRFDLARTRAECLEGLDLVFQLHDLRRKSLGGGDAFHTPALIAFHREFVPLALERGWLRLYVLRLDGKPAACLYGFVYDRKFYFYQSGFDPAFERYSVGLITMGLSIRAAIEEGAGEYDLLHGDEAYKSHWSGQSRDLVRLELFPPGATGRLCHGSIDLARRCRNVASDVLKPMTC